MAKQTQPGDKIERLIEIKEDWPEFGRQEVSPGKFKPIRLLDVETTLDRLLWANVVVDDPTIGPFRPWRTLL